MRWTSDKHTFKALSGGHLDCLQSGREAKQTTSNSCPSFHSTLCELFCQVDYSTDCRAMHGAFYPSERSVHDTQCGIN